MRCSSVAKVGVYGGTFDPVHFGHLNLAIEMMEAHRLEEVWFCPAFQNPHKADDPATSPEHRLRMLELAMADIPGFRLLPMEIARGGPSYTIDTLETLLAKERESANPRTLYLILGADAMPGFFQWHKAKLIVRLVSLLVGTRTSFDIQCLEGPPEICSALQKGLTPIHIMDISSTDIRKRLQQGLYCGHLVPKKVLEYIKFHRLY